MPFGQHEIAKKLDVSQGTISRALNGKPGVNPKLRKSILTEAKKLGYSLDTNFAARSMRHQALGLSQTTRVICAILPGSLDEFSFSGRFFKGLSTQAAQIACEVVLITHPIGQLPLIVSRGQVDGVVRLLGDLEIASGAVGCPTPWISLFWDIPEADLVTVGQEAAFWKIGRHLAQLGHRRVAFIGPEMPLARERRRGLAAGLALEDASPPVLLVFEKPFAANPVDTRLLVDEVLALPEPVTAIAAYNDYMAVCAIDELESRGVQVPAEMSVTGFDGAVPSGLRGHDLTTVALPLEALGAESVNLLHQRLQNPDGPRRKLILETEFMEGRTAAARVAKA
ncbi:MAG: LacI family DNA-binding transcriptional regulator [Planctomycetes bacterium]|nr:LacI family DNA-binding transcriptional regulator [Planctomycetota bacterium]